jgi:hypothetical protein
LPNCRIAFSSLRIKLRAGMGIMPLYAHARVMYAHTLQK